MFGHDELCIGGLRTGICDCDFILKVRKNQIDRDIAIITGMSTKGGKGKWLLRWKVISNLYAQLQQGTI